MTTPQKLQPTIEDYNRWLKRRCMSGSWFICFDDKEPAEIGYWWPTKARVLRLMPHVHERQQPLPFPR